VITLANIDQFLANRTYVTIELMVQVDIFPSSSSVMDVLWLSVRS